MYPALAEMLTKCKITCFKVSSPNPATDLILIQPAVFNIEGSRTLFVIFLFAVSLPKSLQIKKIKKKHLSYITCIVWYV